MNTQRIEVIVDEKINFKRIEIRGMRIENIEEFSTHYTKDSRTITLVISGDIEIMKETLKTRGQ
jgi:hypothetical protein